MSNERNLGKMIEKDDPRPTPTIKTPLKSKPLSQYGFWGNVNILKTVRRRKLDWVRLGANVAAVPTKFSFGASSSKPVAASEASSKAMDDKDTDEHVAKKPRLGADDGCEASGSLHDEPEYESSGPDEDIIDGFEEMTRDSAPPLSTESNSFEGGFEDLDTIPTPQAESSKKRKHVDEVANESSGAAAALSTEPKKLDGKEGFRLKQHRILIKELEDSLKFANPRLEKGHLRKCLDMIAVLEEKYIEVTRVQARRQLKKGPHPRTAEQFQNRIEGEEEKKHPWLPGKGNKQKLPELVMRAWDEISQCQIRDFRVGFLSGGSQGKLITDAQRKLSLTRHADWGNRYKTDYISTSISLEEIALMRVPHFQKRQKMKGIKDNTKLTLININARTAAGRPTVPAMENLLHYKVTTKYGKPRYEKGSFYTNEILLPFRSPPDEIVGTWAWHQVASWCKEHGASFKGWYDRVGYPAFQEHERIRLGGQPKPKSDCKIGCDCCGQ